VAAPAPGAAATGAALDVCFTVDYEPDCPPWLVGTFRGVEEATAPLLALLAAEGVPATFFSTGVVAERYPDAIRAIVDGGHELGCHGHTHRRFDAIPPDDARDEIAVAAAVLRRAAPVSSFRAPNLALPNRYLPLLVEAGFTLDSSQGRYKPDFRRDARARRTAPDARPPLRRIPASVTSSVLRLPRWIREPWLDALRGPVVLFVHPWEFVDLRRAPIRWDCRMSTGPLALRRVGEVLRRFRARGARFRPMRALLDAAAA